MKALRKALHQPIIACGLISLLVLAAVLGVRAEGWLQRPELIIYDFFVRHHSKPELSDDRIVIVGMTEDDLEQRGFPLDDALLAKLLTQLDEAAPCIIGLDLYRDRAEPRNGTLYPQLADALKKLTRVLVIERVGYVQAPAALRGDTERVVANNLPKDTTIDGSYRRGPLLVEQGVPEPMYSLSFALARHYIEEHGKTVELVDVPGHPEAPLLRLGATVIPRLTRDAGGYVGLPVGDYECLNGFEAPWHFRVQDPRGQRGRDTPHDFSFGQVLEEQVPPEALKGKIVLVGSVMQSIKDSNPTPIDDNLRGMQIHATLIHQLLRAAMDGVPPMTWWPEWAEVLWIAAFTLLGGALSLRLRSPWKLAPALALVIGGLGWIAWFSFQHGTWLLFAAPAIGCFVATTFVTSFTAYLEGAERATMQTLFSRHVSTKVAETLWAEREQFLDGGRLKPQRLEATVLFTDLKGFSTISEGMEPQNLLAWINEYMTGIASQVDKHNGMVVAYVGDAIMAVFGAPVPRTREEDIDQDAIEAVECALAMRRELKVLNAVWVKRGMPTCAMRVGIFTGPLVAGSIGSAQRVEFTVLGDTTNTAARLESAGKEVEVDDVTRDCTILIGDATWKRLHGKFVTQLVGPMSLKGKAKQIIVHSVLSAASKDTPS